MVEEATAGDHLIGMALLKKGWENSYFGCPDVYETACVGKIQQVEKLYDGKYNIMLYGESRVKIVEFVQSHPFRVARVEYLNEGAFKEKQFNEKEEVKLFFELLHNYLNKIGVENYDDRIKFEPHCLESIINQVASILDFTVQEKQDLLEQNDMKVRFEKIKMLINKKLMALNIARKIKFIPKDPSWN